jgi:hypothetical protein
MRRLLFILYFCAVTFFGYGQQNDEQKKKAAEEIKLLFRELNEAIKKHDRTALERIYADEFLFIHGFGYIDNKTVQINNFMEADSTPSIFVPSFDQFFVYGDVAVLRALNRNPIAGNNLMSTSVFAKKDSRWQIVQVQSTQQQRERKIVKVEAKILDSYTGKYAQPNGATTIITRESDILIAQRAGRPKLPLSATSDVQFYDKFGSYLTFHNEGEGKATYFVWRSQNGQEVKWNKVE